MPCAPARRAASVTAVGLGLVLAFAAPPPATAATGDVRVRVAVTGGPYTASVGLVSTSARNLLGGFYCAADGLNPTPLTALVDANEQYGLGGVEARWDAAAQDFTVTSIHGDAATSTKKWNAYVNEEKITKGPCHTAIKGGDKIRWTLEATSTATPATGTSTGTSTVERPPRHRRER
ncbi:DUF4430 domain-containing protein [Streptomyces tubercidicus]|uniref:DUF4430 domain-containing protein n=1 Tax=Streptomyces tubercidicus TaxID=47759 RepID=UPI0036CD73A7